MTPVTATKLPEAREIELKCWPEYYAKVESGEKTFEIRQNDRGYKVGDILVLREWRPTVHGMTMTHGHYTGRSLKRTVTYATTFQQLANYVVMSIADPTALEDNERLRLERTKYAEIAATNFADAVTYRERAEQAESRVAALEKQLWSCGQRTEWAD